MDHTQFRLEVIAQCKLHDSRSSLNLSKVVERRAGATKLRVEPVCDVRITRQVLSIGDVEGFPANRQLMILTPGHREALVESRVQREESHASEDVSRAGFARRGTAERVVSRSRIRKQIGRFAIAAAGRRRLDGFDWR